MNETVKDTNLPLDILNIKPYEEAVKEARYSRRATAVFAGLAALGGVMFTTALVAEAGNDNSNDQAPMAFIVGAGMFAGGLSGAVKSGLDASYHGRRVAALEQAALEHHLARAREIRPFL